MDQAQAEKFIFDLLRLMLSKKASDLFITADYPGCIVIPGRLVIQRPGLIVENRQWQSHGVVVVGTGFVFC